MLATKTYNTGADVLFIGDNSSRRVSDNNYSSIQQNINNKYYYDTSSTSSAEKSIDESVKRVVGYLQANKENTLLQKISSEVSFEPGIINGTISYFGTLLSYGEIPLVLWVSDLFVRYYNSDKILKGLLYIASYYNEVFASLDTMMALAAISHKSSEIKELAVRVLESNCNLVNYNALCSVGAQEQWLQEYINDVIRDFKKELCLY